MVPLVKMNGIGNKILVIDMRKHNGALERQAVLTLAAMPILSFDQIMVIYQPQIDHRDALIEVWNRDGSKANACGNGMRCVTAYLASHESIGEKKHFETMNGVLSATYLGDGKVQVDMGQPRWHWKDIPTTQALEDTLHVDIHAGILHDATLVSMGNPHCIFFLSQEWDKIALEHYGPLLEQDPLFTNKANISLVKMITRTQMQLRTWERGAGLTLACGTAACASVVAAVRRGLSERRVDVFLSGGELQVEWDEGTGHVLMTGDTQYEFSGHVDPVTGQFAMS